MCAMRLPYGVGEDSAMRIVEEIRPAGVTPWHTKTWSTLNGEPGKVGRSVSAITPDDPFSNIELPSTVRPSPQEPGSIRVTLMTRAPAEAVKIAASSAAAAAASPSRMPAPFAFREILGFRARGLKSAE